MLEIEFLLRLSFFADYEKTFTMPLKKCKIINISINNSKETLLKRGKCLVC